jgi:WD40 repeat protein
VADNSEHRLPGRGYDIDFTGDESRLVVSQEDGKVLLLDAETLAPVGRRVDFGERVCCSSGGPGNHTASVLVGGPPAPEYDSFEFVTHPHSWAVVDLEKGRVSREGPVTDGEHAELSPDGKTLAIGRADGSLAFVDVATGRLLRAPVKAHQTPCCYLSWTSDSSAVAGSTYDGFVSLWDGRTGGLMGRARIPEVTPASVEFMPDDRTVTIATYTSAIYHWDTSVEAALDHACALAARNLTPDEWETFFPGLPYRETCTGDQLARRSPE